jgi:WD40 repeat protein
LGHTTEGLALAYSPDGTRIVSGSRIRETVRIWDSASGKEFDGTPFIKHSGAIHAVDISRDGARIVSGSFDCTVRMWDRLSGKHILTIDGHCGVFRVAFSPDGARFISESFDSVIRMWDSASGGEIGRFETDDLSEGIWFANNGQHIDAVYRQGFAVAAFSRWESDTGQRVFHRVEEDVYRSKALEPKPSNDTCYSFNKGDSYIERITPGLSSSLVCYIPRTFRVRTFKFLRNICVLGLDSGAVVIIDIPS